MIRSASATTSSSSVETTRTGMPLSRVATICLWMNSIEPTSTPRVGWAATSSRRSRDSSRATTTFCWLPPERLAASESMSRARTSYSVSFFWANSRRAPRRSEPFLTNGDLPVLGDEADTGVEDLARGAADQLDAVEVDGTADVVLEAEEGLGELGLAVALDAGDGENLAGPDGEAEA